jgi:hypothetical protein
MKIASVAHPGRAQGSDGKLQQNARMEESGSESEAGGSAGGSDDDDDDLESLGSDDVTSAGESEGEEEGQQVRLANPQGPVTGIFFSACCIRRMRPC